MMTLTEVLQLNTTSPAVISFCGGGGKTSSMLTLARELKSLGKSVLIVTTTKIFIPLLHEYDHLILAEQVSKIQKLPVREGKITVMGPRVLYQKLKLDSISFKTLDQLREKKLFQFILIEADGAQCRPLKAPGEHEPVIYPKTDLVIGVTGIDSYQKTLSEEWVHRPEQLAKIVDQKLGSIITEKTYQKLIQSPIGLFKNAPKSARKAWILNKVDNEFQLEKALQISNTVKKDNALLDIVLVTCLKYENYLKHFVG